MKKIVVFGSSNVDIVVDVERMPQPGETVRGKTMCKLAGGKGANQACACGKLHGQCSFLSAVGCDDSAQLLLDSLEKANVDARAVLRCEETPTGSAHIQVDASGENSIVVVAGANAFCNRSYFEAQKSILLDADYILTQLETPLEDTYDLIVEMKAHGKTVILNPAPAPDELPERIFDCVSYFTPNETELEKITGMPCDTKEQIIAAAKFCIARGMKNVLVTMGKRGAMLVNREEIVEVPAFVVKAVDTTAAGDTFNGAFVTALADGLDTYEAIRFANAASAVSVTRYGAQPSVPTREEVLQFLQQENAKKSE